MNDIATIIWICSDLGDGVDQKDVLEELMECYEHQNYLESLAEMQQAEGERAADEVYCGYYD